MKRLIYIFFIAVVAIAVCNIGCDRSEGKKFAILQKVSHKSFPCSYNVMEVAFQGGRSVGTEENSSYENTQEIKIDQAAYDTLQEYLGENIIFDYKDEAVTLCGPSKVLTSIKIKKTK